MMTGLPRFAGLAAAALLTLAPAQAQPPAERSAANAHLPAQMPEPGPMPGFATPQNWSVVLDNGLTVTFIPWGMTPTVDIRVTIRAGNIDEGEQTWLSDLAVEAMTQGAAGRSEHEIAEAFGAMGGSLLSQVQVDTTTFMAFILSESGPDAVALLAETVRQPDFPAERFEAARNSRLQMAEAWRQQPAMQAMEAMNALHYPEGHPFHILIPSRDQLNSYTREDARRFHREHFGAGRTHIYITGQFDADAMEAAVRQHFGDWERGPADDGMESIPEVRHVVHMIDRPGAPQTTVFMAYPVPPVTDKSRPVVEVMDTALGGMIAARLLDTGNSYAPNAFVEWTRGGAAWIYTDDIDTDGTVASLQDVLTIIDYSRFRPLQLGGMADWMISRFIMSTGSRLGIVEQIAFRNRNGLPLDYLDTYADSIRRVDSSAVQAMARENLTREQLTLVVVGDLDRIEAGIRALLPLQDATFVREEADGTRH